MWLQLRGHENSTGIFSGATLNDAAFETAHFPTVRAGLF
jgi:hypothetical protein